MDEAEELDWLTDMDLEILEIMSSEFILSPTIIAENIGRSREGVSSRLSALQAGGLVTKIDRGKYRISDDGLDVWYHFDKSKYRNRRREVIDYRTFKAETGLTRKEYEQAVEEEHQRILREEPDCDDPLRKAFEIVDERIQDGDSE